ncbi:MAG: hypothetical protein JO317_01265, partial [Verrucomicrobiae bacterium]|nr:hypothetical protein [Verrucomicrobiae bacterium]
MAPEAAMAKVVCATVLRRARGRLALARLIAASQEWSLVLFAAAAATAGVTVWLNSRLPGAGFWTGVAIAAVAIPAASVFWRRPPLKQVARLLDRRASLQDRLVTSLEFEALERPTPFQSAAVEQTDQLLGDLDPRPWLPLPSWKGYGWLVVPALCVLNLWLYTEWAHRPPPVNAAAERRLVEKSRELGGLSRQLEKEAQARGSQELQKMAAEFRRTAEETSPEAGKSTEQKEREALAQWSRLENRLAEMAKDNGGFSQKELSELARALEENPADASLARMLKQGDLAGAAQEMQAMMQQGRENAAGSERMRSAAQRMSGVPLSSEQGRQLMQQMQQAARSQGSQDLERSMGEMSQSLSNAAKRRQQSQAAQGSLSGLRMSKAGWNGLGSQAIAGEQGLGKTGNSESAGSGS